MSIRVVLADDHRIVREGLRSLLEADPDIEIVAEASDGRTVIRLVNELKPDIVIMDISMPDMNGIQATRMISKADGSIKIIALSMHSDRRFVTEMLDAGASGYLLKDCALEELSTAIKTVFSGQVYISHEIATTLVKEYNTLPYGSAIKNISLSQKEINVLKMIADGMTTRKIADKLNVSAKTIETHRQHIMEKTGVNCVAELTKYAIRIGLTSIDK